MGQATEPTEPFVVCVISDAVIAGVPTSRSPRWLVGWMPSPLAVAICQSNVKDTPFGADLPLCRTTDRGESGGVDGGGSVVRDMVHLPSILWSCSYHRCLAIALFVEFLFLVHVPRAT